MNPKLKFLLDFDIDGFYYLAFRGPDIEVAVCIECRSQEILLERSPHFLPFPGKFRAGDRFWYLPHDFTDRDPPSSVRIQTRTRSQLLPLKFIPGPNECGRWEITRPQTGIVNGPVIDDQWREISGIEELRREDSGMSDAEMDLKLSKINPTTPAEMDQVESGTALRSSLRIQESLRAERSESSKPPNAVTMEEIDMAIAGQTLLRAVDRQKKEVSDNPAPTLPEQPPQETAHGSESEIHQLNADETPVVKRLTASVNPYEALVAQYSEDLIKRLIRRVRLKLQRLSPADHHSESGFTLWDEICIQVQEAHSILWPLYEEIADNILEEEVLRLRQLDLRMIWITTGEGWSWADDAVNDPESLHPEDGCPCDTDVVARLRDELFAVAANFSSPAIDSRYA